MQLDVTSIRDVIADYFPPQHLWLYEAFDAVNRELFDNELPQPLILPVITAHGGCLGLTASSDRPPVITIHPSTFGGTEKEDPWGIPPEYLGNKYALDVLIHECTHVCVNYLLGGANGPTSHENTRWIDEVNRVCPLIGLNGVRAALNKPKRIKETVDGKTVSRVRRSCEGSVPFDAAARYPHAIRRERGEMDYYKDGRLPWGL